MLDVELVERLRNKSLESVELVGSEGLLDVVVGALAHRLHRGIDSCLAGDDDALRRYCALLQLLQQGQSIDLGHLEVGEDDAERLRAKLVEGFLTINGNGNVVPFIPEYRAQPFRDRTVVVRDEDLGVLHLILRNGSFLRARLLI